VGFGLLAKECKDAEEALTQALGYAAITGARYIAITNGHQWILALTFVPNQPIAERSVYVFESLEAISARFRLFWDCFSPEGIAANRPASALLESRKAPPPPKTSHKTPNYPAPAVRNRIANELSTVLGAVWDTMQQDEESDDFLKECYVEPDGNDTSLAQAVELLERRLSAERKGGLQAIESSSVTKQLLTSTNEKPIVVLGRVGHGKSTFLRYLKAVKAKEILDKYIQIHVNFIHRPDTVNEVGQYIYDQVEQQLQDIYRLEISDDAFVRAVLHAELNRFNKSTEGKAYPKGSAEYIREELAFIRGIKDNKHEYLKRVIAHLRGQRQFAVAIFFDNLDRRNPTIQEEAYLRASAVARDWSALTFVCLRPSSYYHSKVFGVIDSVAPRIINVVSPKTSYIITKRLKYAKKYAEGDAALTQKIRDRLSHTNSFQLSIVSDFLECMIESFRRQASLVKLFSSISNGNIRELLTYIYNVLTSTHLDTGKILEKYMSFNGYLMPEHEALRALLYCDSIHYNPEASVFINLYDIQRADAIEHFSRFLSLHYLRAVPEESPYQGWCTVTDVERYLCQLGYADEHARYTLRYLFNKRCCEAREPVEEWTEAIKEIRITSMGKYHISSLVGTFQYVDAITIDTPILEERLRAATRDVTFITDRLNRCDDFADYLNRCSSNIHDAGAKQLWKDAYDSLKKDIARVRAGVV